MQHTLVVIVVRLLALFLGLVWGFFVAFNMVFSDVYGAAEMFGALAYVLAAYGLLGLMFGALERSTGWRWVFWLAPPGLLLILYMLHDSAGRIPYVIAVFLSVIVGSAGGAWVGAKLVSAISARRHQEVERGSPA
jgi:uncharacterized protein YneF (UPF0154 family)